MQLTDHITSSADLVWIERHHQLTNSVGGYETCPAPGLYGSIRCIYVGRDGSDNLTPAFEYTVQVNNFHEGDLVYDLSSAKQGVFNCLWLLSMAVKQGYK